MNTLWMLTNETMCERIESAKNRVIYVAPGLCMDVAKALVGFVKNNGPGKLAIILDESPHICRLGYGEIKAVEILLENGVAIRIVDKGISLFKDLREIVSANHYTSTTFLVVTHSA
jgi:hypothetical protein